MGSAAELALHPEGLVRIRVLDGAHARPLFLHLSRLRGARWADLLRFVEGGILDSLECTFVLDGGEEGEALARLYPAGLVALPHGGEPVQLPLHEMETIQLVSYRLRCSTPHLDVTLFGCEPRDLARVHQSIVEARRKIDDETAALLTEFASSMMSCFGMERSRSTSWRRRQGAKIESRRLSPSWLQ